MSRNLRDNLIATVATLVFFLFIVWVLLSTAIAQSHHHPPQDAGIHDAFYSNWMRPDQPSVSCCNKIDCYPTEARYRDGKWFARRREDGKWLFVPPAKIEQNRDSPDGRNHLCASAWNDTPICFVSGGGT